MKKGNCFSNAIYSFTFLLLSLLIFAPILSHINTSVIGYAGDSEQEMWFLTYGSWAITHGTNPFITNFINYPYGVNLMWNSSAFFLSILMWPILSTVGVIAAYNLLIILGIALSGILAFFAFNRYLPKKYAFLASALYEMSPFLLIQALGHSKVVFDLMPPLLFIVLDELIVKQRKKPYVLGIILGIVVSLQLLIYEESIALAAIAVAISLIVLSFIYKDRVKEHSRYFLTSMPYFLVTLAVIDAYPLYIQFFGSQRLHGRVPGGNVYVTDLSNILIPTVRQLISPAFFVNISNHFSGNLVENGSYLGAPLVLLLLLAIILEWKRAL